MAISTPGVGSGLDVNSIVTQLVALEKQPLQKLQQRATTIQSQISSWGKLQSLIDSLRTAATRLSSTSTWSTSTVASSDTTTASASLATSGSASPGRYSITVNQLAQEHTLASAALANGADLRGHLKLELGTYDNATPPGFTTRAGSTAIDLDFTDPATTVYGVRDAINAAGGGIKATVLSDGAGERLILSASDTGKDRALKVTASGATASPGLGSFAYDGSTGSTMAQTRAARDASFSINGVALTSATNTLDGTISGVKVQLLKGSGATTELSVEADLSGQRKLIEDFVTAFNAVNTQIANDTGYDAASRKGGLFQGDSTALSVRQQLRDLLGQSSTASSSLARLSDLGVDIKRDGSLSLNATKLNNAMASQAEVAKLFSAVGSGTDASKGIGVRLKAVLDQLTSATGALGNKADSLKDRLTRNQSDQDKLNTRVEATRQRLLRQYQSVDGQVAKLNGLGSYVSRQFGA